MNYSDFEEALRKYKHAAEVSARAKRDAANRRILWHNAEEASRNLELLAREAQREVYWQMDKIVEAEDG